jgi:hypothetical protein
MDQHSSNPTFAKRGAVKPASHHPRDVRERKILAFLALMSIVGLVLAVPFLMAFG